MDRFDLRWPKVDAALYTDGWRCRIVWRQRGGPGGTIDNNVQCKHRVADSLLGAPYLLSALKARGHGVLASEIETIARVVETPVEESAKPIAAAKKPTGPQRIQSWLERLEGSADFSTASARRAKAWTNAGQLDGLQTALKIPAAKGKQEWVLKLSPAKGKGKAEYIVAENLKGVMCYLAQLNPQPTAAFFEAMLAADDSVEHPELALAATAWRESAATRTH